MSDGNVGENDPYGELLDREKQGVRPDFLQSNSWDEGTAYRLNGEDYDKNDRKIKKKSRRIDAGLKLANAEKDASNGGVGQDKDGLDSARKKESSGGLYSGLSGFAKGKSKNKKKDIKGILKKSTPLVGILTAFTGVTMLISTGQNMLPLAIKELITEKLNSVGISSTVASDDWLDTQLNQGVRSGAPKKDDTSTLYAFSDYQVQQFESQGIKVVSDDNITALLYQKNGQYIPVVGSVALEQYSSSNIVSMVQSASGFNNIGGPVSAKEALADQSFKNPYTTATKAWRGGVSGWFDNIMDDITQIKLNITRNRWAKYVAKSMKGVSEDLRGISEEFKKTAKSTTTEKTSDDGVTSKEGSAAGEDEDGTTKINQDGKNEKFSSDEEIEKVGYDTDGASEEDIEKIKANNDGDSSGTNVSGDKIGSSSTTVEGISKVLNSKAVKAASAIADYGCALLEGLVSIYTIVSAYQNMQFLNLVTGFLESVDKTKAGDGSGSPYNEYGTTLTTKADTKDDNGDVISDRQGKTAVESAGVSWLFGDGNKISQSDPSVRNTNFESIMSNISILTSNIKLTTDIYAKCGYVRAGLAAVDLATTVISFIPIFGGAVKGIQLGVKEVAKVAIKAAVQIALYAIIPIAAKNLANMMLEDVATEWFGEDLGNALVSGANKYLGGNGTSGGQSPGSSKKVAEYIGLRDAVIAEEAEYQRSIRSPFDVTSRHTFLGSLAYSIMPLAYSNGLVANMKNVFGVVSSSVTSMLPTADAIDEQSVLSSTGDCNLLGSTGAVGDAFCNPYIITDMSTIATSPVAVNDMVHNIQSDDVLAAMGSYEHVGSDNFNDDGSIKEGSDLAKYITFCGQRTSQYGIKDLTIAEQVSTNKATKIMNYVPVVNDFSQIYEGLADEANLGWSNGSACVATDENAYWGDNKWYQRYAENERLLENINPGYTSTVTAYLRDYYEENPLDQSFEGTLARFSGMTKEGVEDTLALIEYYDFLKDYKPSERYAFGEPKIKDKKELKFNNNNDVAKGMLFTLINQISYADVRNRSFAV